MSMTTEFQQTTGPLPPGRRAHGRAFIWIAIAAVVLIAAAVTVVYLTVGRSLTVAGTVLDSETGNPVAAVTVQTGGRSVTADAQGMFRMEGVKKDAGLTFTANNYATDSAIAATSMTVRLNPLPVNATARSAMTDEPLAVTFEMPDGMRVTGTVGGPAEVHRVGPGDTVKVSSPGYVPGEATVGADRTIAARLQPAWDTAASQIVVWMQTGQSAKITHWVLSEATGYQYEPINILTVTPDPPYTFADGRIVVGQNVTAVVLATATPEAVPEGAGYPSGWAPVKIAGQEAWHGSAEGMAVTAWHRGPIALLAMGSNTDDTDAVMKGILSAQPAT